MAEDERASMRAIVAGFADREADGEPPLVEAKARLGLKLRHAEWNWLDVPNDAAP
jgi:hypothetical protein